ncbi:MAG: hypothetical protein IH591_06630 [Bacteroidales bacterium]|nr:hypothetical protein [Bacteroidales bacterium]
MKRLNKLYVNPERILKGNELMTLRGGYDSEDCPCGYDVQQWTCSIYLNGTFLFSGIACGSQEEILGAYPKSAGYFVRCEGGSSCGLVPIGG